jgi:hypothetical protein
MFFIKINELFIIILRNKTYRGFKMIKIDDKKIIVSFFDELKKVLEEYNTYNYFFLMNEISITEDIFIGLNVLTILLYFSLPSLSG